MVQVLIECENSWSENEPLRLNGHFSSEVTVRPDAAQKTANAYLGLDVGMAFRSGKPILVLNTNYAVWRMPIELHWYGMGKIASLGEMDVDALTNEVVPLGATNITKLQERANVLIERFALSAKA